MTNKEKRAALVAKIKSREGKNQYTQSSKRDQVSSGCSDCSSLQQWVYEQVLGINIGDNTEAQMLSKKLTTIDAGISGGVPDEDKLLPGDLLYFRGTDPDRKATGYVGHVEMYVGNGELSGHGSGVGPTRKNMKEYCQSRQKRSVAAPIYNRGLICVRRGLPEDDSDRGDANNWKGKLTELYVTQLGRMPDEAGLAFWQAQLAGGKSWDEVSAAVIDSDEGRRRYVRELYVFLGKRAGQGRAECLGEGAGCRKNPRTGFPGIHPVGRVQTAEVKKNQLIFSFTKLIMSEFTVIVLLSDSISAILIQRY